MQKPADLASRNAHAIRRDQHVAVNDLNQPAHPPKQHRYFARSPLVAGQVPSATAASAVSGAAAWTTTRPAEVNQGLPGKCGPEKTSDQRGSVRGMPGLLCGTTLGWSMEVPLRWQCRQSPGLGAKGSRGAQPLESTSACPQRLSG